MSRIVRWVGCLSVFAVIVGWFTIQSNEPRAAEPKSRVAWTTSKVVGSPEPPPGFKIVNPFPNVLLKNPLLITHMPGTNRMVVAEQAGKIHTFPNTPDAKPELFFDPADLKTIKSTPNATGFEATYGLVFHPKFVDNRTCFVCYTVKGKGSNLPDGSRVSRFKVSDTNPPKIDVASEEIVLTYLQGGHNGGDLHFGNDGYLYISTGDSESPNPPDARKTGQDITDLMSSILRIDVDKKAVGKNYAIPKDNPFIGLKIGDKEARPEVWAYGFRNPWRMSFDRKTGDLWVGDVGWELWEMVHKVVVGGNYGWSIVEGRQPVNVDFKPGPTPILPPVIEIPHTAGGSVTGGYIYRGKKLPELYGQYVFGDWLSRRLWSAKINGTELQTLTEITKPTVRVVAFGEDHDNELYFLDYDAGTVHTLVKNDTAASDTAKFPKTLSTSGLFADVKSHQVATGIYPFEVTAHQWQDHATAEYFVAMPGSSLATDYEGKKTPSGDVGWRPFRINVPNQTVLVKTISLEMEQGNPKSRKRLETQLLHFDGENFNAYSYAWRDDQTDADLVPAEGAEKTFTVQDPMYTKGKREQTWTYNSRTQCLTCHNMWAENMLAFNLEQLNRTVETPLGAKNQLEWLGEIGLLNRVGKDNKPKANFTTEQAKKEPNLTDPHDKTAKLEDRAKSYLHANCGHCHRFGGGGAVDFELHAFSDFKSPKLIDAKPTRGTFDLPDAKLIASGDPCRSAIFYRMSKFGNGRMPHLGSELPDDAGMTLVREWIQKMPSTTPSTTVDFDIAKLTPAEIATRLGAASTALDVAYNLGCPKCAPEARDRVLTIAAKLPSGHVRDLFEGYLPSEGKERKLGSNPRPRAILSMAGDAVRGKELYVAVKSQCVNCHKLDGQGLEVGPELTAIAKQRTREHLLESLLEPSRKVEPKYQSYLLKTADGRAFTGLLIRKDAKEIVLRDAQNKEVRVEADNVELFQPARESLMPAGLLADFTLQQAADLLEFLSSRK